MGGGGHSWGQNVEGLVYLEGGRGGGDWRTLGESDVMSQIEGKKGVDK